VLDPGGLAVTGTEAEIETQQRRLAGRRPGILG